MKSPAWRVLLQNFGDKNRLYLRRFVSGRLSHFYETRLLVINGKIINGHGTISHKQEGIDSGEEIHVRVSPLLQKYILECRTQSWRHTEGYHSRYRVPKTASQIITSCLISHLRRWVESVSIVCRVWQDP
jgi:hypothetical protein